jgi:hypothetical protein
VLNVVESAELDLLGARRRLAKRDRWSAVLQDYAD